MEIDFPCAGSLSRVLQWPGSFVLLAMWVMTGIQTARASSAVCFRPFTGNWVELGAAMRWAIAHIDSLQATGTMPPCNIIMIWFHGLSFLVSHTNASGKHCFSYILSVFRHQRKQEFLWACVSSVSPGSSCILFMEVPWKVYEVMILSVVFGIVIFMNYKLTKFFLSFYRWVWCLHHCVFRECYPCAVHRRDCGRSDWLWVSGHHSNLVLLLVRRWCPGAG